MTALADIRARAAAATPGPWENWGDSARGHLVAYPRPGETPSILARVYSPGRSADAEFIAAARSDVPWLCDRVDELEAALRTVMLAEPIDHLNVAGRCAWDQAESCVWCRTRAVLSGEPEAKETT